MNGSTQSETPRPPPSEPLKPARSVVLNALKHAYGVMKQDVTPLEERYKQQGANALNTQEKALLADFHILTEGRKHASPKTREITIRWEDEVIGGKYVSREGIPVEGLLEYLQSKINLLKIELASQESTIEEATTTLEKRSHEVKVNKSPNDYIVFASNVENIQGEAQNVGIVDVVHLGNATAYVSSSREAIEGYKGELNHGQDAAAILVVGNKFALVEADGVGQAYLSELAAKAATESIAKSASADLKNNLATASDALLNLTLPEPNSGVEIKDLADKRTKEETGSETMLNQLSVDATTGQIDGLLLGDGGFTILRVDGTREHYSPPDQIASEGAKNVSSRLSTKSGIRGEARSLKDIVKEPIILALGDSVLLYSDAMQHVVGEKLLIDQVCDILVTEKNPDNALAKLFKQAGSIDANDDDKSLLRYTHSPTEDVTVKVSSEELTIEGTKKAEPKQFAGLKGQIDRLSHDLDILNTSSMTYEEARQKYPIKIKVGAEEVTGKEQEARDRLEAAITHLDELRRSEATEEPAYSKENWYKAQETLRQRRRELIVPRLEPKPTPPEPTPPTPTPTPTPPEGKRPPTAPVPEGEERGPGKEGELPTAPIPGEERPGPPEPVPPEPTIIPPELALELNVGVATDESRIEQEVGGLMQHDRARDKPAKGFVKSVLSLVPLPKLFAPREFIRNFWQNTLFKGAFDARSLSFSRSMMEIARSKHAGLDSSIPFEMPQEIQDKAVEEGRKIRRSNPLTRFLYTFYDLGSGLTGLYQNSDMIFARKWFEQNGKPLVEQAKQVSLAEQTQLGERFALEGKNEDVISKEVGEVRYLLNELISDKAVRDQFQTKLKEFISQYATGSFNDETLLKQFNEYYHKEIYPKLSPDKQKELKSIEVSSNVLRLAKEMRIEDEVAPGEKKIRYQRYQDELTEEGKKAWDELEFRIYVGRAKYETARGEVRLSRLERGLIHRMVERDYRLSRGLVLNSAVETLKDIGIYGGAYIVGGTGAAWMFGRSAFHLGGLIATPVMAGLREGVLFSKKGRLYGIRGKSVTDFEQVSRELAVGRKSMDKARLRPMFEKAMVDQRHATGELMPPIVNLLNKETLTPDEQKALVQAIAHAKARMKLSDLSTQRKGEILGIGKISVAQNFIGYSEGKQNEEMTALRAAIVQGTAKLSAANPQLYTRMREVQTVYEAQLRFGSHQNKLGGVVARELGVSQADAQTLISEFYQEDLGIDTQRGKSLASAAFTLAKTVDKRAFQTAAFAAVVSPIIGAELKILQAAGAEIAEISSEGLKKWSADWGQVIHNNIPPVQLDAAGKLVSDLTPAQKAGIWMRNIFEPPLGTPHNEQVAGATIQLPWQLEHGQVDWAGEKHDVIIDIRTGDVKMDFDSHTTLDYADKDYNGDGILGLVIRKDGVVQTRGTLDAESYATSEFHRLGVDLVHDPNLDTTKTVPDVLFKPEFGADQQPKVQGVDLDRDGKFDVQTKIPDNTNWVHNPDGTWDLQGVDAQGKTITLIDDATIDVKGNITGVDYFGKPVNFNATLTTPTLGEIGAGVSGKEIWDHAGDFRIVHVKSEEAIPMRDYTFEAGKDANGNTVWGIETRFHLGTVHNPNVGINENVNDSGNIPGAMLDIPGIGQTFVEADELLDTNSDGIVDTGSIKWNPLDTTTQVTMADGTTHTMAEVANNILNQDWLKDHNQGDGGELASQFDPTLEGRHAFNLAHEGKSGALLVGFLEETDETTHAVSKDYGHTGFTGGENEGSFTFFAKGAGVYDQTINLGEVPPTGPTFITEVDIGEITKEISKTVSGFRLAPPPGDILTIYLAPYPMRENIEKSTKGEPAQAASAVSAPTQPVAARPPLSREEQRQLEARRKELEEKKKRIEDAIKSKKAQGFGEEPTEEQKKALDEIDKELSEIEVKLHPPTKETEETKEAARKEYTEFRTRKLKEIEDHIAARRAGTMTEEDFKNKYGQDETADSIEKKKIELVKSLYILEKLGQKFPPDVQKRLIKEERKKLTPEEAELEKSVDKVFEENEKVIKRVDKRFEEESEGKPEAEWIPLWNKIAEEEFTRASIIFKEGELEEYHRIKRTLAEKVTERINKEGEKLHQQIDEWEVQLSVPPRVPETQRVKDVKREIFELTGKRTEEEITKLIDQVHEIHYKMLEEGKGKLPATIDEAEKLGFKEIVCEGFITYIPKGAGELVVVGDLHGDFATLSQIIEKKQFIENMESDSPTMVLVFEGDYLDRGKKDVELMEALLELKRRYPKNVVLMKADHEVKTGVSHHDYPDRAKSHYGDESVFNHLHDKLLDTLPRAVFCGNGVVMVHGGPLYYDLDLRKLATLHGDPSSARTAFDGVMTWADPEPMTQKQLEDNQKTSDTLISEIDVAITAAESSPNKKTKFHGQHWMAENLIKAKKRLEIASKNGFWFNPERIDTGDLMDAVWSNLVIYSEQGLEHFLSSVGGKVMIRGHQTSSQVEGGKPNPFSKNILWTIHSTGKGSADSYYSGREFHPSFAEFNRNEDVAEIDPIKNIVEVWK